MAVDGRFFREREEEREKMIEGGKEDYEAFIRRVSEDVSRLERQREGERYVQDMLDAMLPLTNVTRAELEEIAARARSFSGEGRDTFFSVTHQVVLASVFLFMVIFPPALCLWVVS